MAATLVRPTQDRRIDTTPHPRRYRWHAPLWLQALGGLAAVGALWACYVGLWAVSRP